MKEINFNEIIKYKMELKDKNSENIKFEIKEYFIATNFGWLSPNTPPVNHNKVVVLVWLEDEKVFQDVFGFFENNSWHLEELSDTGYEILGWFPYPYSPDNN